MASLNDFLPQEGLSITEEPFPNIQRWFYGRVRDNSTAGAALDRYNIWDSRFYYNQTISFGAEVFNNVLTINGSGYLSLVAQLDTPYARTKIIIDGSQELRIGRDSATNMGGADVNSYVGMWQGDRATEADDGVTGAGLYTYSWKACGNTVTDAYLKGISLGAVRFNSQLKIDLANVVADPQSIGVGVEYVLDGEY